MAHVSMALIKAQYDWDWAGAEKEFQRAIALAPELNLARQIHGWYLIALGRPNEAQAEMRRTVDADPLDDFGLLGLGLSFYFARQYEPAIEQYRRAIGVDPKSHWQHMLLGSAYEQQDRFADAVVELNEASRLFNNNPQVLAALGHVYARSGQRAAAQKVIADLLETARRRYVSPYDIATIYAGLGDKEQALAWLEKASEDRSGWLAWWVKVDPKFDTLRSEPRFHNLLRHVGHTL
jgi:tetratricopeptide (TPR) repeat protein